MKQLISVVVGRVAHAKALSVDTVRRTTTTTTTDKESKGNTLFFSSSSSSLSRSLLMIDDCSYSSIPLGSIDFFA